MQKKENNESAIRREHTVPASELHIRDNGEGTESSRTITGYAILFDTPSAPLWSDEESEAREVISPEAVTRELLDSCDIKFTMFHDRQLILARSCRGSGSLTYTVDQRGVAFAFEAPHTADGDKALELVRRGDLAGCSFAFSTRYRDNAFVGRTVTRDGDRRLITYTVRAITGIYDFTLAADPAYPDTSVEIREADPDCRQGAEERERVRQMREQVAAMRRQARVRPT